MVGSLFMGCFPITMQSLSQSSKVKAGMTTDEVRDIMGEPVMTELDRDVEEWHYCRYVINKDRYLAIFFVDNKVIAKIFYTRWKSSVFDRKLDNFGSCEHFVKTGDYKVPPEVQAILDKNTPTPSEFKSSFFETTIPKAIVEEWEKIK